MKLILEIEDYEANRLFEAYRHFTRFDRKPTVIKALAQNILDRYFNTEYFDPYGSDFQSITETSFEKS